MQLAFLKVNRVEFKPSSRTSIQLTIFKASTKANFHTFKRWRRSNSVVRTSSRPTAAKKQSTTTAKCWHLMASASAIATERKQNGMWIATLLRLSMRILSLSCSTLSPATGQGHVRAEKRTKMTPFT